MFRCRSYSSGLHGIQCFWYVFSFIARFLYVFYLIERKFLSSFTVLQAKSDSDFMFCLQSYKGPIIDRSLVY